MRYLDYLPDVFKETREYQALGKAAGPLVDGLREEVEAVPEEYFPTTAEELLPRWERVLGLKESGTLKSGGSPSFPDSPASGPIPSSGCGGSWRPAWGKGTSRLRSTRTTFCCG